MKYSVCPGTPPTLTGGGEERVAFMEFGDSAQRRVFLQLQLWWPLERGQGEAEQL